MNKYRFEYFASCPTGLEEVLSEEILSFGVKDTTIVRGGVKFEAYHEIALKVLLYSRIASRVFKYLYDMEASHEKDLYHEATEIKWKSLLDVHQTFKITTIYGDLPRDREFFTNSQFTTLKLKDAIVDYFRHYEKERPSVSKDAADIQFLLRIEFDEEGARPYRAILLYDLCGEPLNQRGYRVASTEAPVKENLAAGILKLIKWDPKTENFLDAMTGSGTFSVEACLIAADIPPSYLKVEQYRKNPGIRSWCFVNTQWFQKDEKLKENFELLLKEIETKTRDGLKKLEKSPVRFLANDISKYTLESTMANFKKARLDKIIEVSNEDALDSAPVEGKNYFFVNPPYGERLNPGEIEKLKELYKNLGDLWKKQFKGHRAALLVGEMDLLKSVGLRTKKRHILFNGDIECRLAEYDLF